MSWGNSWGDVWGFDGNNVVLGPLSQYNADAILRLDGNDYIETGVNIVDTLNGVHRVKCRPTTLTGDHSVVSYNGSDGNGYFQLRTDIYDTNKQRWCFQSFNFGYNMTYGTSAIVVGETYDLELHLNGSNVKIYVNGVLDAEENNFNSGSIPATDTLAVSGLMFDRTFIGDIGYYDYVDNVNGAVFKYEIKNQYGNTNLIDTSGNENTATISGATWWKYGVDEVYATKELYKASWDNPMLESQSVNCTDTSQYLPVNDVYWNPYNQDATYTFSITGAPPTPSDTPRFARPLFNRRPVYRR